MRTDVVLCLALLSPVSAFSTGNRTNCTQSSSPLPDDLVPVDTATAANVTNSSLALQLSFINNSTTNAALNIYATGLDDTGRLIMLNTAGDWVYPQALYQHNPSPVPLDLCIRMNGSVTSKNFRLTVPLLSGRIWVAQGDFVLSLMLTDDGRTTLVPPSIQDLVSHASNGTWTFAEMTYSASGGLWVNPSYVDLVSLVLRLVVVDRNRDRRHAYGLANGAVKNICAALAYQSQIDGHVWDRLCIFDRAQQLKGILSPNTYLSMYPNAFAHYWDDYLDRVWQQYTVIPLTIDTQSLIGLVSCTVQADDLHCSNGGGTFAKPNSSEVFGCSSGPFVVLDTDNEVRRAIIPRLCAAIHRSTLLRDDGHIQPGPNSIFYYADNTTNHYSKIVHQHQIENIGYAFPYDDVVASHEPDQSNTIHSTDPQELVIFIDDP